MSELAVTDVDASEVVSSRKNPEFFSENGCTANVAYNQFDFGHPLVIQDENGKFLKVPSAKYSVKYADGNDVQTDLARYGPVLVRRNDRGEDFDLVLGNMLRPCLPEGVLEETYESYVSQHDEYKLEMARDNGLLLSFVHGVRQDAFTVTTTKEVPGFPEELWNVVTAENDYYDLLDKQLRESPGCFKSCTIKLSKVRENTRGSDSSESLIEVAAGSSRQIAESANGATGPFPPNRIDMVSIAYDEDINGVGGYYFSHNDYTCSLAENDDTLLQAANNGRMPAVGRERAQCMRDIRATVIHSDRGSNYFFNIESNNDGVITSLTRAHARGPYDGEGAATIYNDSNFGKQNPTPPGLPGQWLGPGRRPESTGSDLDSDNEGQASTHNPEYPSSRTQSSPLRASGRASRLNPTMSDVIQRPGSSSGRGRTY